MDARLVLLLSLCALQALLSTGRPMSNPLVVEGRVYCDTCLAGFETSATTFIAGAKVRVECKARKSMELIYSKEGTTDSSGTYRIPVNEDHESQICDAMLISSPDMECNAVSPGRERARVILTNNNGIVSNTRFANSMGFMRTQAMSGCSQVLRTYQDEE